MDYEYQRILTVNIHRHVELNSKVGIIKACMKCEFLMAVTVNIVAWNKVLPPSSGQLMQLLTNSRYK
jgi:hypothetical protein